MKVLQILKESSPPDLMKGFEEFLPLVMNVLGINKLPPIKIVKDVPGSQPSFGGFDQDSGIIYIQITNRHPLDIFRTLAHELVHFKQDSEHKLDGESGSTGSPMENEANATAGVVMRHFNKKYPEYLGQKPLIKEDVSDYEIHNYAKLDEILMLLCKMVIKGQKKDNDYYGMVAACVLDPDNNMVAKVNYPTDNGKRVHAERAAMEAYQDKYGEIPKGSIIITTCSPCNEISDETADERSGNNCTDLINNSPVRKVYCGYMDPSQGDEAHDERDFNLMETEDGKIRDLCKSFADTFLDNVHETQDLEERRKKKGKVRRAAYGLGLYGGYGYFSNYGNSDSGDAGGGDGGGESIRENITPTHIHKLADRKGVKWDNEPSFLRLTKRLTGKEHLDDLDHSGLNKVKRHLDGLQGVAEAFDQPYSIKWEEGEDSEAVDALATLGDGTYLSIMFSKEFGDYGDDLGDWAIEFHRNNSQEVSGEGDAQKVFATVLEAIRQFTKKYKPNTVTFSASKEPEPEMVKPGANANPESRAKLYNRLVQRYAGAMGYTAQQQEGNGKVTYVLKRASKGVTENFADGKNPGRKGLAKRSGVNTKASVSDLRKTAKNSSGEKQRMAHWLANMKAGRAK